MTSRQLYQSGLSQIKPSSELIEETVYSIEHPPSYWQKHKKRILTIGVGAFLLVFLLYLNVKSDIPLPNSEGAKVRIIEEISKQKKVKVSSLEFEQTLDQTDLAVYGQITDFKNIEIQIGKKDFKRSLVTVKVKEVIRGETTKKEIQFLGPMMIAPGGQTTFSQMKKGNKGYFFLHKYGQKEYLKVKEGKLWYRDLSLYGLLDGENYLLVESGGALLTNSNGLLQFAGGTPSAEFKNFFDIFPVYNGIHEDLGKYMRSQFGSYYGKYRNFYGGTQDDVINRYGKPDRIFKNSNDSIVYEYGKRRIIFNFYNNNLGAFEKDISNSKLTLKKVTKRFGEGHVTTESGINKVVYIRRGSQIYFTFNDKEQIGSIGFSEGYFPFTYQIKGTLEDFHLDSYVTFTDTLGKKQTYSMVNNQLKLLPLEKGKKYSFVMMLSETEDQLFTILDEKGNDLPIVGLTLSPQESKVYLEFKKNLNRNLLKQLSPKSVMKLFAIATFEKEYEAMYALHGNASTGMIVNKEDYLQGVKSDEMVAPFNTNTRMFFTNLNTAIFKQTDELSGGVELQEETLWGFKSFNMVKGEDGIWGVSYQLFQ